MPSFKVQIYKWVISFGSHLIGVLDLTDSGSVSLNVKLTSVCWLQQCDVIYLMSAVRRIPKANACY